MPNDEHTLYERVTVLETQQQRIISDLHSEKGTRARINKSLDDKLNIILNRLKIFDRIIYLCLGALFATNYAFFIKLSSLLKATL